LTIIYGILGLGLLVFVHELGHFILAKIHGVTVESFSLGMGPVLIHKQIGDTDYRLSLIPLGGYCGLKGQKDIDLTPDKTQEIADKDSFAGISPLKRISIAFAGPFFNLLFAFIAFTVIAILGTSFYTTSNKIILVSDIDSSFVSSAKESGLQTGDIITEINGKKIGNFSDLYEIVSLNPEKEMTVRYQRGNTSQTTVIKPTLDKATGMGKIGVYSWVNPTINGIEKNSFAEKLNLQVGDTITYINNNPIFNTIELQKAFEDTVDTALITLQRDTQSFTIQLPKESLNIQQWGIQFPYEKIEQKTSNVFKAIKSGFLETINMINLSIKSFALLFKGIDLTNAVSGPLRITSMLGETAKTGFSVDFKTGIVTILQFLSLISISLCIMNLLPIPILDGGLILFAFIEFIFKKPLSQKAQIIIQYIGLAIIAFLVIFAFTNDFNYFIQQTRK